MKGPSKVHEIQFFKHAVFQMKEGFADRNDNTIWKRKGLHISRKASIKPTYATVFTEYPAQDYKVIVSYMNGLVLQV